MRFGENCAARRSSRCQPAAAARESAARLGTGRRSPKCSGRDFPAARCAPSAGATPSGIMAARGVELYDHDADPRRVQKPGPRSTSRRGRPPICAEKSARRSPRPNLCKTRDLVRGIAQSNPSRLSSWRPRGSAAKTTAPAASADGCWHMRRTSSCSASSTRTPRTVVTSVTGMPTRRNSKKPTFFRAGIVCARRFQHDQRGHRAGDREVAGQRARHGQHQPHQLGLDQASARSRAPVPRTARSRQYCWPRPSRR